jgi:hypothetical protein
MHIKNVSKDVTRASQSFHAPPILGRELFPVGDFGQDFDGEVNVTDTVNVLAQHAPEEDHPVDPAEEPHVPAHPLNARQKLA